MKENQAMTQLNKCRCVDCLELREKDRCDFGCKDCPQTSKIVVVNNIWGKIISLPDSVKIGAYCDIGNPNIGPGCKIQCHVSIPPGWIIGKHVFIGPGVRFANDKHPSASDDVWATQGGVVEDDVVIGMGALIGPSVHIGKGATIGMGAVVVKDVEAGMTVVGNPARPIN